MSDGCRWVCDDDDANCWVADCAPNLLYTFNEGGPRDSHFRFCPYCGKPLVEVPHAAPVDDEPDDARVHDTWEEHRGER